MSAQLWFTHLAAFTCGGLLVYLTMRAQVLRKAHPVTEQQRERSKAWVVVFVLAAILITFGLQVKDSRSRDRESAAQATRFQDQQACLNRYSIALGQYLTDTLNTRVQANKRMERAQEELTRAGAALSRANTAVVLTVAGGFDVPPTATKADLVQALNRYRELSAVLDRANDHYVKVKAQTQTELDATGTPAKPYNPPKVDCTP